MQLCNISASFLRLRSQRGEDTAYIFKNQCLSFGELAHGARAAAKQLSQRGFGPRHRVLLIQDDGFEWPMMFHALIILGCIPVLINPAMPSATVFDIVNKVNCTHALGQRCHMQDHRDNINNWVEIEDIDFKSSSIYSGEYSYQQDDLLLLLVSSGTNGTPKIIQHRHQDLEKVFLECDPYDFAPGRVLCCSARMSWSFGLITNVLGCVASGATCIILKLPGDLRRIVDIVDQHGVTDLFGNPALIKFFIKQSNGKFNPALKKVWAVGEIVPQGLQQEIYANMPWTLGQSYGTSETLRWAVIINGARDYREYSIGKPTPGVEVKLVDDQGNTCAVGEVGELWIKHSTISAGYWDNNGFESQFVDGWFNTRDLMYQDQDGFFFMLGRSDQVLKINGHFVSALDIENQLNSIPGVTDSVVVFDHHQIKVNPLAFITVEPNTDVDTVCQHLSMPSLHRPQIFLLPALPLTANNKKIRSLKVLTEVLTQA